MLRLLARNKADETPAPFATLLVQDGDELPNGTLI